MKTDINYSINMRGFEATLGGSTSNAKAGLRTRRTSWFQMNAYKMIAKRAIKKASK